MTDHPSENPSKSTAWMTMGDALWLLVAISAAAAGTWQSQVWGGLQRVPLLLFVIAFLAAFTFSLRRARRRFLNRKKSL